MASLEQNGDSRHHSSPPPPPRTAGSAVSILVAPPTYEEDMRKPDYLLTLLTTDDIEYLRKEYIEMLGLIEYTYPSLRTDRVVPVMPGAFPISEFTQQQPSSSSSSSSSSSDKTAKTTAGRLSFFTSIMARWTVSRDLMHYGILVALVTVPEFEARVRKGAPFCRVDPFLQMLRDSLGVYIRATADTTTPARPFPGSSPTSGGGNTGANLPPVAYPDWLSFVSKMRELYAMHPDPMGYWTHPRLRAEARLREYQKAQQEQVADRPPAAKRVRFD